MTDEKYWLCCGSKLRMQHKSGCNEAERGFPQHCRFGTAEEHSQWSRKQLEITDEEIIKVLDELSMDSNMFDFARAILRKAQEK